MIKTLITITISLLIAYTPCVAQDNAENLERPKVGLVLSGGSAHGLAHIGVLKHLEELNMPVDYITGTSMGAIIGALRAMGYDSDRIRHISENMRWNEVINDVTYLSEISPAEKFYHGKNIINLRVTSEGVKLPIGLSPSNKLDLVISRLYSPAYKIKNFNQLTVPFRCYAVDVVKGEVYTFENGNIGTAVRSSMAIPTIFPPVKLEDKLLVDGGFLLNFPAREVRKLGADIVIGSYVGAENKKIQELQSFIDIMRQLSFMASRVDFNVQKEFVDVLLTPEVKGRSSLDFSFADFYINQGYVEALNKTKELNSIIDSFDLAQYYEDPQPIDDVDFVFIDDIVISDQDEYVQELVLDKLEITPNSYTSITKIEEGIKRIYATQTFRNINYYLDDINESTVLKINCEAIKEVSFGGNINRFNSTGTAVVLNASIKNYLKNNTDLKLTGRISEFPSIAINATTRGGIATRNFVFGINFKTDRYKFLIYEGKQRLDQYNLLELDFSPNVLWEYSTSLSFHGFYNYKYHFLNNRFEIQPKLDWYKLNTQSMGGDIVYNSLDDQINPRRGLYTKIGLEYNYHVDNVYKYTDPEGTYDDFSDVESYFSAFFSVRQAVPLHKHVTFGYHIHLNYSSDYSLTNNYLVGGAYQDKRLNLPFIGLTEGQAQYGSHLYSRAQVTYNIRKSLHINAAFNFIHGYTPIHTLINDTSDITSDLGFGLGLLLDLPTGPLQIDFGYNVFDRSLRPSLNLGYRHIW